MLTNAQIKMIRSLREKKFRDESGLFIIEGEKMLKEAINSGYKVELIVRNEEVGEKVMERISLCSSASPVLGLVHKKSHTLDSCSGGLCLALDRISDPGNLGTIIRIADWFGIKAIFVSKDTCEEYNPKVVQASMGSIFRVPIIREDLNETIKRFPIVYGTFLDGEDIYKAKLKTDNALIVMGNESNGISPNLHITNKLLIPSYGDSKAESLNVAVATAITISEFRHPKKSI